MKFPVECLLKRPGGTVVDLYGTTYHFKAENDPAGLGRHVCEVTNAKHFQRFMQIPEAYAVLDDDAAPAPAPAITTPAPAPVNPQALGVASGPAPDLGAAIAAAPGSGEWSEQDGPAPVTLAATDGAETDQAPPPAPQPDNQVAPVTLAPPVPSVQDQQDAAGAPPALPTEADLEAMTLDALRAQAEKEIGRKPSPKAKPPLLISQIMAARAEAQAAA